MPGLVGPTTRSHCPRGHPMFCRPCLGPPTRARRREGAGWRGPSCHSCLCAERGRGDLLRLRPGPIIWGGSLCLLMRPRAPTGLALSHVRTRRCPAPDTIPSPWNATGGGKGWDASSYECREPQPASENAAQLIRAAQWYSVLIHIGFGFHKLLNSSWFWGTMWHCPQL